MSSRESFLDKFIGIILIIGLVLGCLSDADAQEACQELKKPEPAVCYRETTPVYYCSKLYTETKWKWVAGCQSTVSKEFGYVTEKGETAERKASKHQKVVLRAKSLQLYRKGLK